MAVCQHCKTSGGNMRKCNACRMVYCRNCATKGRGPYPKVASNRCPHCGQIKGSKPA